MEAKRSARASKRITEARAAAQRAKLDEQAEDRRATPETAKRGNRVGRKHNGIRLLDAETIQPLNVR